MKKAFSHSIIIAITAPAHACFQIIMMLKESLPLMASKLRTLIGMNNYLSAEFAPPEGELIPPQTRINAGKVAPP